MVFYLFLNRQSLRPVTGTEIETLSPGGDTMVEVSNIVMSMPIEIESCRELTRVIVLLTVIRVLPKVDESVQNNF